MSITNMNPEALRKIQVRGALTYLSAYVVLMAQQLEVPVSPEVLNEMLPDMIEPLNHATEAVWRATMGDGEYEAAVERFSECLRGLRPESTEGETNMNYSILIGLLIFAWLSNLLLYITQGGILFLIAAIGFGLALGFKLGELHL